MSWREAWKSHKLFVQHYMGYLGMVCNYSCCISPFEQSGGPVLPFSSHVAQDAEPRVRSSERTVVLLFANFKHTLLYVFLWNSMPRKSRRVDEKEGKGHLVLSGREAWKSHIWEYLGVVVNHSSCNSPFEQSVWSRASVLVSRCTSCRVESSIL